MGTTEDMNKKRQELISQKIKHVAALKKLKSDLTYTNRRDEEKIQEIKNEAAVHIKKRNDINSKLRKIDNLINKSTVQKPRKEEMVMNVPMKEQMSTDPRYEKLTKDFKRVQDNEMMLKKLPKKQELMIDPKYEKKNLLKKDWKIWNMRN